MEFPQDLIDVPQAGAYAGDPGIFLDFEDFPLGPDDSGAQLDPDFEQDGPPIGDQPMFYNEGEDEGVDDNSDFYEHEDAHDVNLVF
jgi:hypothetical protein